MLIRGGGQGFVSLSVGIILSTHVDTLACDWSEIIMKTISYCFFIRWFKFTLKPPYSIAHDNLRLAIWDTSFWTFLLKFGHKEPSDIS